MKVRFGYATGVGTADPEALAATAHAVAVEGFDSLWIPETLTTAVADPVAALGYVAGAVPGLKIGVHAIVAGRNVVRLARQLATLDRLSAGRLLVVGVTGLTTPAERSALGVDAPGADLEQTLPVLRRLLAGETVTAEVGRHRLVDVHAGVTPIQQPLEIWLGGRSSELLDRCGRLGDGWLPGLCGAEQAAAAIERIERSATAVPRTIDPEHFGVNLTYAWHPLPESARRALAARARRAEVDDLVPVGPEALREAIGRFVDHGISKFVLRPVDATAPPADELRRLAEAIGALQT